MKVVTYISPMFLKTQIKNIGRMGEGLEKGGGGKEEGREAGGEGRSSGNGKTGGEDGG